MTMETRKTMDIEDVKKRMEMAISYYRSTKTAMADEDPVFARRILFQFQEGKEITSSVLAAFLNHYHNKVSLDWLFFGEGEMLAVKPKVYSETPKMAICRLLNELSEKVDKLPL